MGTCVGVRIQANSSKAWLKTGPLPKGMIRFMSKVRRVLKSTDLVFTTMSTLYSSLTRSFHFTASTTHCEEPSVQSVNFFVQVWQWCSDEPHCCDEHTHGL